MPGTVQPTECEAIVMMARQVNGEHPALAFAGRQGNFELNAMWPIIVNNMLHMTRILADGAEKFRTFSVEGTELDEERVGAAVDRSLMLATALSPVIGYQKAAHIPEKAQPEGTTLREAALLSGVVPSRLGRGRRWRTGEALRPVSIEGVHRSAIRPR